MVQDIRGKITRFARKNLLFVSVTGILLALALLFLIDSTFDRVRNEERQDALESFYTPPDPLPDGKPGEILRMEPLDVDVPLDGKGFRILYLSERSSGQDVAVSGMIFYPSGDAPEASRPVVAWAHPTVGMGRACAPSRTENPVQDMSWLGEMLDRGWVVVATDYAGLGTPGVEHYLVGRDEARDVINSVRAALNIDDASAGPTFAIWSHSQGGHAALFSSLEVKTYAPELNLVGTAAAAPASELAVLMSEQYKSDVGWVIGPEVLVSWPDVYTDLSIEDVASSTGLKKYRSLADDCLARAGEEAFIRSELKEDFFKINPVALMPWYQAAVKETPVMPTDSKPLFIAQGLDDKVVIPDTTALFIQQSCKAGVNLTTLWLGGTGHVAAAKVAGPAAVSWLDDRFRNKPANPTCEQPMPVEAAKPAAPPPGT